jgi:TRAP-type C4-dicarboxylate transport system permease small subunit
MSGLLSYEARLILLPRIGMAGILNWVSRLCARGTSIAVLIIAVLLVGCLLVSIFFRYIIGYALSFPEELSMLLFAWLILLTGSLGVREGFHVRLTIVTNTLPASIQKVLTFLVTTGVMVFGGVLLYSGQGLVTRTIGNISATIGYPIEILYYPAPVCGALIILHCLSNLFNPRKEG